MKWAADLNWGSGRSDLLLGGYLKSHAENDDRQLHAAHVALRQQQQGLQEALRRFRFQQPCSPTRRPDSCSDLNLELSSLGNTMTHSFNLLFKFWHSPGDADLGETVSPHVSTCSGSWASTEVPGLRPRDRRARQPCPFRRR